MMSLKTFCYKAKARVHRELILKSESRTFYHWLYRSYWHSKFNLKKNRSNADVIQYMTARPNPGAGIGHQISNWLAGYTMAQYYSLTYSTYPFSDFSNPLSPNEWDSFLGLNCGEVSTKELLNNGYKKVLLPRICFETSMEERNLLSEIIKAYAGKKVVFLLEMDQFVGSKALGSQNFMREKYWNTPERKNDVLQFDSNSFNVAVHIRRGDIVQTGPKKNENLTMRWLDMDYYHDMLDTYLHQYSCGKKVEIYLFSQADKSELEGFEKYGIVHYCNKMDAKNSFLHMINADMLIMSISGMSYQAAVLNMKGIIVYAKGYWGTPVNSDRWINVG